MQYQVCNFISTAGMDKNQANEHQRRWSEGAWNIATKKGNYDRSRAHLNFEIIKGGKIQPIDNTESLVVRFKENLKRRGIKEPNEKRKKKDVRTLVHFIFSGSSKRMNEIAFGDQEIDFLSTADNSHIHRLPDIEKWAKDIYDFVCKKWGEENIIGFICHLDETTPHIHCSIIPVTPMNKISFKYVFAGENKNEYSNRTKQLHNELAVVNKPWGLERGKPTGNKRISTERYRLEIAKQTEDLIAQLQTHAMTLDDFKKKIGIAERRVKGLETMANNLREKKEKLDSEIAELTKKMEAQAEGMKEKIKWEIEDKMDELNKVIVQLDEKEEKLDTAIKVLEDMNSMISEKKKELEAIKIDFNNNTLEKSKAIVNVLAAAVLEEAVRNICTIPEEDRANIERKTGNTFFSDMATAPQEIFQLAADIFVGNVAKVLGMVGEAPLSGGGGGGSHDLPKKKKDEDDNEFARRCFRAARTLMAPKLSKKKKR